MRHGGQPTEALEASLRHGSTSGFGGRLAARRVDDDRVGRTLRHQPYDRVQVGGARRGGADHGLVERSRAPHTHGRATSPAVAARVTALRQTHPTWGPKKRRAVLADRAPEIAWPAASTLGELLPRQGLSQPRRRHRYVTPLTQPLLATTAPNEVWTADFKGWVRTGDGTRCDPFTVADAYSRFVLCCRIVPPTGAAVAPRGVVAHVGHRV